MAVETTDNRKVYSGDGVTTAFPTTFQFLAAADLVVILRDEVTGEEVVQTLTTHYTVAGGSGETGTVTFLAAPSATKEVTIYNDPAITQSVDLIEGDVSPAETKERAYDRLTMIAQRLADRLDRSIRLTEGFTQTFDLKLPAILTPGKALVINQAGDGFDLGPDVDDLETIALTIATALANIDVLQFAERGSAPSTPVTGFRKFYAKADGLYQIDDDGVESKVGGAGGGGGGFTWLTNESGDGPEIVHVNNRRVARFIAGETQKIYAEIVLPTDYAAGQALTMKIGAYSPSSANTFLIRAVATLVRKDADAITSTTNQRTTTNTALTNTVANQLRQIVLDLSSTIGQINSVNMAAGSRILVEVARTTDTDTADVDMLLDGVEVKIG